MIRSLVRNLIKTEKANNNFGEVCKLLIKNLEISKYITQDMQQAINLLREIRNTIHNNGHFFNDKMGDAQEKIIEYRGQKYIFSDSLPHNNANYTVLASITKDIVELFNVLVNDPAIKKIEFVQGTSGNVFDKLIE